MSTSKKVLPIPQISKPGRPAANEAIEQLAQSLIVTVDFHCRTKPDQPARQKVFEAVNALAIAAGTCLRGKEGGEAEFFWRALECQLAGRMPAPEIDPGDGRARDRKKATAQ